MPAAVRHDTGELAGHYRSDGEHRSRHPALVILLGVSEPNPYGVGYSWDTTQPSIEPMSVAAGHTVNTSLSHGGL
jgi:hypothetical protein